MLVFAGFARLLMKLRDEQLPKLIRDDFPHPDGPNAEEIALKVLLVLCIEHMVVPHT